MIPAGAAGSGADHAPFIVTAELPPDLLAWAAALRRAHYPPERNHLGAHVTLFHALPPSLGEELRALLARLCAAHAPPPARLAGLLDLGRGTALRLESPAMLALRDTIAEHCHGALTAQDRHRPRLHVTIQNKVAPEAAQRLQAGLRDSVPARDFRFAGLALHRYRGGPWEAAGRWSFRGARG